MFVISDLKFCVNCTALGNGARQKGVVMVIISQHMGEEKMG
jgi:hypothetical protein